MFDLDGVVRLWPQSLSRQIEATFSLPDGAFAAVAFETELVEQAVSGAIADQDWRQQVAERLSAKFGTDGAGAVALWSHARGEVDQDLLALTQLVRRNVPIALLTNATTRLREDLEALNLMDSFDFVFNSSEIGSAKPHEACFRHVLTSLGMAAQDCALIDDTAGHVTAASALGFRGHLYRSRVEAARFLRDVEVL